MSAILHCPQEMTLRPKSHNQFCCRWQLTSNLITKCPLTYSLARPVTFHFIASTSLAKDCALLHPARHWPPLGKVAAALTFLYSWQNPQQDLARHTQLWSDIQCNFDKVCKSFLANIKLESHESSIWIFSKNRFMLSGIDVTRHHWKQCEFHCHAILWDSSHTRG